MPRIIKHPSIRKAELVASAQALFFERGYDRTSVDEIIARAGISKGAFYYYFPSKEAVLEALATQMADNSLEQIKPIIEDETLNAFERLNAFLGAGRQLKKAQAGEILASFEMLFRPENLVLYHRIHRAMSRRIVPMLAGIVAQGSKEGSFRSSDPEMTAEIMVSLITTTHDVVARMFDAQTDEEFERASTGFERRCIEQGIAIDRILGLPDGSIEFIEPGFAQAIFAGWRERRAGFATAPTEYALDVEDQR